MRKTDGLLLEKVIEHRVTEDAKKLGVRSLKLELKHDVGWPDRLYLIPGGVPLFIEFKRAGKRPSRLQYHRLSQLKDLGYNAEWADSYLGAMGYIESAMASARRAKEGSQISS